MVAGWTTGDGTEVPKTKAGDGWPHLDSEPVDVYASTHPEVLR